MTWIFCTSGSAIGKAGIHNCLTTAPVLALSASLLLGYSSDAEGYIEQSTHTDWTTTYSTLPTGIKNQLSQISSSLIALDIVALDPTGYLTREADMLANKLTYIIDTGISNLRNQTKNTLRTP